MSKTPRTDALHPKQGLTHAEYRKFARELETELAEMRDMFTEYVKAEDAWREQLGLNPTDYLHLKAKKLRKQAKEVLGL